MTDHPCGTCLNWWECNGVAWGTIDCPHYLPAEDPPPQEYPFIPAYLDDRTESGLLEE